VVDYEGSQAEATGLKGSLFRLAGRTRLSPFLGKTSTSDCQLFQEEKDDGEGRGTRTTPQTLFDSDIGKTNASMHGKKKKPAASVSFRKRRERYSQQWKMFK